MRIYIAHASNIEYEQALYEPLKNSPLWSQHEFVLPHAEKKDAHSKDVIASCDLVIAEVSAPSTGEGIEIGWADAASVPVVCIHISGTKPSGSLRHITKEIHDYKNVQDMLGIIEKSIKDNVWQH